MLDYKVFHPAHHHEATGGETIPCSIFLKPKKDAKWNMTPLKSRLVAGGHREYTEYLDDTSSPTADTKTVMQLLDIAVNLQLDLEQVDVKMAYLNADMCRRIFMRIPADIVRSLLEICPPDWKDYLLPDCSMVVQIDRAIYGMRSGEIVE